MFFVTLHCLARDTAVVLGPLVNRVGESQKSPQFCLYAAVVLGSHMCSIYSQIPPVTFPDSGKVALVQPHALALVQPHALGVN